MNKPLNRNNTDFILICFSKIKDNSYDFDSSIKSYKKKISFVLIWKEEKNQDNTIVRALKGFHNEKDGYKSSLMFCFKTKIQRKSWIKK